MRSLLERVLRLLRSPAGIYLAASVMGRIGSIILLPLYTRKLSAESYGTYGLALTLLGLMPLLLSCGLTSALTKEFFDAKTAEEGRVRVGSAAKGMILVTSTLALLVAVVIFFFFPNGLSALRQRHLFLIDLAAVGTAASFVPDSYLRAAQRPRPVVALQLGSLVTSAGFGILFVSVLGRGVDGAIEAATASALVLGGIGLIFTVLHLGGHEIVRTTRRQLAFSVAFVPHFIATWVQDMGDRWLLSTLGGGASLGPYYVAGQLLSPVPMVVSSWNASETPRLGELYRAGGLKAVRQNMGDQYRRYAFAALVPALGIVCASPVAAPFIGPNLRSALTLLPILALAYFVDAFYYPSANAIFYSGRPRAIPVTTIASAAGGLLVAYLLLRAYGIYGLVAARVVTSALRTTLVGIAARIVSPADSAQTPATG